MLVDIEERRRKIRVSPIFPKYSKYFREVSFHQEGLLHQGFFTTNFCAREMAKRCTFLQLITISLTLVFILTITPISRNLKITADGNRASLASAEPLNSSSWVCTALAKQVNGCSCSSYKECFPLHHGALWGNFGQLRPRVVSSNGRRLELRWVRPSARVRPLTSAAVRQVYTHCKDGMGQGGGFGNLCLEQFLTSKEHFREIAGSAAKQ